MKRLTIILGPTAVGKSAYALEYAERIGSPIINCDSRQIYKEFNIGVARPSEEQLRRVKHYLIATHSITEYYTAGKFELEALDIIERLFQTHDELVMCGGSGLYIDALCCGIDPFPAADSKLREELTQQLKREGLESLQQKLKEIDAESFNTIEISNPQRVIRAIEVTLQTGKKFSQWKSTSQSTTLANKKRDFQIVKIGLNCDRALLYDRINKRVDIMMQAGLLEEVISLDKYRWKDGLLHSDLLHIPPLRTVGYRELFDYIDKKCSLEKAIELIKRNTRHYAKRQMTWWGRDKNIEWQTIG